MSTPDATPPLKPITPLHVLILIDSSGSMYPRTKDVIGGFNSYLEQLRNDTSHDYFVSVATFDSTVHTLHEQQPVTSIEELTDSTYAPAGNTALLDAIGAGLKNLTHRLSSSEERPFGTERALVVIMTDGEENSSKFYTLPLVRQMIEERQVAGNWTFVYLGADQNAWSVAQAYGFARGNTVSMDSTQILRAFDALSVSTQSYASSAATASTTFATDHGLADADGVLTRS